MADSMKAMMTNRCEGLLALNKCVITQILTTELKLDYLLKEFQNSDNDHLLLVANKEDILE